MSLQISAGALDVFARGLREAPEMTQRALMAGMTEATLLVERETVERIPRGATGLTAQSITGDAFSTPMGVLGVVASSQPSATYVELGTKPHWAPLQALVPWVREVLGVPAQEAPGVAYLVARKIARRGTEAQRPFARAVEATQAQVVRIFETVAARVAANLATTGGAA